MKVVVFCEQRDGKLKSSALEALTVGSAIAGNPADCAAVIVGSGVEGLAGELAGYGCDTVYTVDSGDFANYNPNNYTTAVAKACETHGATTVIGSASPMGRDIFARLAARMDGALMTDLTTLELNGDKLTGTKPMYAGKCLAKVSASGGAAQLATIRPNVIAANKSGAGSATVSKLDVAAVSDSRITTKEIRKGNSDKLDLTEAPVIISGGRAMGNEENFKILHECADVIGATVGASRAAVDSGYAGHHMQVGQTGKTVNPNLYIACGISGSIQHMAGMRTSKVIVAINTDPEAPIFKIADYGIVADLFEAVPLLTTKFKELLG
jgi:electron transfer flavoprotein alpha subunit